MLKSPLNTIKNYLIAGFLAFLPFYLTAKVTIFIITKVHQAFQPILPDVIMPGTYLPSFSFLNYIFSIIISIFILAILGLAIRNYLGKKIIDLFSTLVNKIPFINSVYGGIKKLLDTFLNKDSVSFKEAVLVEFPRKGIFTIGFISSQVAEAFTPTLNQDEKVKYYNVFVPTTPNPTSGFLLLLPETDIQKLDIPVESAFKTILSGGIIS